MSFALRISLPFFFVLACSAGDADIAADPDLSAPGGSLVVETPAASDSLDADSDDSPTQWTAGIVERSSEGVAGVALLADVRIAENEGFDRIVLEFEEDELPGYRIEYIDRPVRQCGSGEVVEIEGDGWLSIRLEPANAHTEAGEPTVIDRSRRPGLAVLRQAVLICDFEAQVEWVLGVASPNRYRVMELVGPTRLIVDVRH